MQHVRNYFLLVDPLHEVISVLLQGSCENDQLVKGTESGKKCKQARPDKVSGRFFFLLALLHDYSVVAFALSVFRIVNQRFIEIEHQRVDFAASYRW